MKLSVGRETRGRLFVSYEVPLRYHMRTQLLPTKSLAQSRFKVQNYWPNWQVYGTEIAVRMKPNGRFGYIFSIGTSLSFVRSDCETFLGSQLSEEHSSVHLPGGIAALTARPLPRLSKTHTQTRRFMLCHLTPGITRSPPPPGKRECLDWLLPHLPARVISMGLSPPAFYRPLTTLPTA